MASPIFTVYCSASGPRSKVDFMVLKPTVLALPGGISPVSMGPPSAAPQ
ncbi:hypothetical protein ACMHUM_02695 [Proteus mirabilis]